MIGHRRGWVPWTGCVSCKWSRVTRSSLPPFSLLEFQMYRSTMSLADRISAGIGPISSMSSTSTVR
jgi:hypothetical protein